MFLLNRWRRLFFCSCLALGIGRSVLLAASNAYGLPEDVDSALRGSIAALFNDEFAKADTILTDIENKYPDQPMVQVARVIRYWWEMSSQVLETDEEDSKLFLQSTDRCLKTSQKFMSENKNKALGLMAMGTTLGLLSRWSATNRAWFPAFIRGSRAADYCQKALKINPTLNDAYMTIGTFTYAKDFISKSLSEPDKIGTPVEPVAPSEGLAQLRKTYEEGDYFQKPAGLMLAGLLANENPAEAIPLLQELRKDMPRSAFIHVVYLTTLYNAGDLATMEKETESFAQMLSSGTYPARYQPQAYFAQGLLLFRNAQWKEAAAVFDQAFEAGTEKNPYCVWALLYKGYALDAAGKRYSAKKTYQAVLKLPRRFASHDHAQERLSTPFQPTDVEMKKVEL